MSSVRRTVVGLTTMFVLAAAAIVPGPPLEICTTDLNCAEMHGVDLYGNPYPPKEN